MCETTPLTGLPRPVSETGGAGPVATEIVPNCVGLLIPRCGQVVEQYVEARVEQHRPAGAQEREEVLLVLQQLIQAAIERVVGDRPVAAKEIAKRAVFVPVTVKAPLAGLGRSAGSRPVSSGCPASACPAGSAAGAHSRNGPGPGAPIGPGPASMHPTGADREAIPRRR